MKKIALSLMAVALLVGCTKEKVEMSTTGTGTTKSQTVPVSSLPTNIIEYVDGNFPGLTIMEAELDDNDFDIELNNGLELSFDVNGQFIGWETDSHAVAVEMLPLSVSEYVFANYSGQIISDAEQDIHGYDVELSSDVELYFDIDGNFVSMEVDD